MTLLSAIIVFLLVILVHELGHFTMAKLVGIKVNEFSIGMGKTILQKEKGETKYSIRLLPIGGYVAMEGEDEVSDDPRNFNNVSIPKRMIVVVAGVVMNFILAIFIFFIIGLFWGTPLNINEIGSIEKNSPAYYSELKSGDKILKVNDKETKTWADVLKNLAFNKKSEINLEIQRDGKIIEKNIELNKNKILGVAPSVEKSLGSAIKYGFEGTWNVTKSVFESLKLLVTRSVSVKQLSGPIGVIAMIGKQSSKGIQYLLQITAIISVNLGVLNILPIPALDGGKFFFLLIEAIRGKPMSEKWENILSLIGISALLLLMLYVTVFGDLARLLK